MTQLVSMRTSLPFFLFLFSCLLVGSIGNVQCKPNYREALDKALLFFQGQRSGRLPPNQQIKWRSNSGLSDGRLANVIILPCFLSFSLSLFLWNYYILFYLVLLNIIEWGSKHPILYCHVWLNVRKLQKYVFFGINLCFDDSLLSGLVFSFVCLGCWDALVFLGLTQMGKPRLDTRGVKLGNRVFINEFS